MINAKEFKEGLGGIRGADGTGLQMTVKFDIENEKDALEVAEDIALLEGIELIYLLKR